VIGTHGIKISVLVIIVELVNLDYDIELEKKDQGKKGWVKPD